MYCYLEGNIKEWKHWKAATASHRNGEENDMKQRMKQKESFTH